MTLGLSVRKSVLRVTSRRKRKKIRNFVWIWPQVNFIGPQVRGIHFNVIYNKKALKYRVREKVALELTGGLKMARSFRP